MLREHYPSDKLFVEILVYVPNLSPELEKIDSYLKDEKLYRLIKKDLSQRRPKATQTGRNSTPVEVILRILVMKRLYGYSYEETERQVSDSLSMRQFCRVYLNAVPDDTTLIRWANLIQPKTVEGRTSVLKRAHGLGRCLNHEQSGFQSWVGWGVIAGNLAVLGRA